MKRSFRRSPSTPSHPIYPVRFAGVSRASPRRWPPWLLWHSISRRYLDLMVDPLASLAPGSDALLLREWVWKLPIAGAFGLIALHFAVRSARAFLASDDSIEREDGEREEPEAGPPA